METQRYIIREKKRGKQMLKEFKYIQTDDHRLRITDYNKEDLSSCGFSLSSLGIVKPADFKLRATACEIIGAEEEAKQYRYLEQIVMRKDGIGKGIALGSVWYVGRLTRDVYCRQGCLTFGSRGSFHIPLANVYKEGTFLPKESFVLFHITHEVLTIVYEESPLFSNTVEFDVELTEIQIAKFERIAKSFKNKSDLKKYRKRCKQEGLDYPEDTPLIAISTKVVLLEAMLNYFELDLRSDLFIKVYYAPEREKEHFFQYFYRWCYPMLVERTPRGVRFYY